MQALTWVLKTKENGMKMAVSVTGTKIFITGGDHDLSDNIIHLVLAKLRMPLLVHAVFRSLLFQNFWSMKMAV